jgi:hypothetical protein
MEYGNQIKIRQSEKSCKLATTTVANYKLATTVVTTTSFKAVKTSCGFVITSNGKPVTKTS